MANLYQDHLGGVDVIRVLFLCLLMAVGVTQPGGVGTTIFVYDDAFSALGTGYRFSEIAAAFPADFFTVAPTGLYQAKVDLQVGDAGVGTATTSLIDTDGAHVYWDLGKTLKNRLTQTTSWVYSFGTKLGTGNQSSGNTGTGFSFGSTTSLAGLITAYGCKFSSRAGAMAMTPATDNTGEIVDCLLQSVATGVAPINLGSATNRFANVYNVDFSHSTTTSRISTNLNAVAFERITMAGNPTEYLASNVVGVTFKDIKLIGTPSSSDFRWNGGSAQNWKLYRPEWSGNAIKFANVTSGLPDLANSTVEYRRWNLKTVDRNGVAVPSIAYSLTDVVGNSISSGTTNSTGEVSFGSGLAANMVPVMDHYVSSGTTYAQRHRSPFTLKVNTRDLAGYNPNYLEVRQTFNIPGYEGVTTTAGQFLDWTNIVSVESPSGGPTGWAEISV